ncbi:hypothetical protein Rahaq_4972 (plasmid) [Rahnella aceris]|uniref:Morphogenetic protein n=1 Tax=Rahnella sp. (strain Y9602) TaxID=2703885 RepID=A0A0H3FH11_RAHSY|nr:hypothetical protein [Rahnella aceris]ADW76547.1 hypothetical protein Rahaq_4972 [Rahnella aceris]
MKERPILFNAEMVKAILSGRKTQTRRVIKFPFRDVNIGCELAGNELAGEITAGDYRNCPLWPGDQLWVREAFRMAKSLDLNSPSEVAELSLNAGYKNPWAPIQFEADGARTGKWTGFDTPPVVTEPGKLRPSLHMPRWASRIDMLITGVRVERLNSISEQDARAEGITDGGCLNCGESEPCGCDHPKPDATDAFAYLWQSIYGVENWFSNPWVWVIEFEHLRAGRKG